MTANTPQSRKARGRFLQKLIASWIREQFQLHEDDVISTSMGCGGEDLRLSPKARSFFPYSIECKNTERVSVWSSYDQACANAGEHEPLLIIKRNRREPLAVVNAKYFIGLHKHEDV